MKKKVLLHEMTRGYFEEYLKENPKAVAIIPLGSIEQHVPHLPLGSDMLSALERSIRIAELTDSFVVQPCLSGYSPHHLDFKGTISFKTETLIAVLMDTIESLRKHDVQRVLFVNTHAGNEHIIGYVKKEASLRFGVMVASPRIYLEDSQQILDKRKYKELDIHAGRGETSVMLKLKPDLVEMERVVNWKPSVKISPELKELLKKEPKTEVDKLLIEILLPIKTIDITDTGIYGFLDPNDADPMKYDLEKSIEPVVEFIKRWKEF
ncbi:MAG: creatininase family protein [Nitrospirota bacterium]